MKKKTIRHRKWLLVFDNGLWEANHDDGHSYVNFSQEPDQRVENLIRILDSAALRREQDSRVLSRLAHLQQDINSRLGPPNRQGECDAKPGEALAVGKALCEIKDKRLYYLTAEPEKYLEINRQCAEIEAKLRAELTALPAAEREDLFNAFTPEQLDVLDLCYGVRPEDWGAKIKPNSDKPRILDVGAGKHQLTLEWILKNLKHS